LNQKRNIKNKKKNTKILEGNYFQRVFDTIVRKRAYRDGDSYCTFVIQYFLTIMAFRMPCSDVRTLFRVGCPLISLQNETGSEKAEVK
jgi:hypothetical protein